MAPVSGGTTGGRTRLRNQMKRLFNASVRLVYKDERGEQFIASHIADRGEVRWDPKRTAVPSRWESKIRLGAGFFNEIVNHPVPLNMNILKALKRSSLGLDLYLWLTYRTSTLKRPMASLGSTCTASSEWIPPRRKITIPSRTFATRCCAS